MKQLTIGKLKGIHNCSTSEGIFVCLALDHRQNLKRALNPNNPKATTNEELQNFKLKVCSALSKFSTATLLDPEYSAAQAISKHVLGKGAGLIVALEATGYTGRPTERVSRYLDKWDVRKAKMMGADAVKLLVYYHPDAPTSKTIESLIKETAEACVKYDMTFMLESLSYSLNENQPLNSQQKKMVITETARNLSPLGPDILKIEFPLEKSNTNKHEWAETFANISEASCIPWILLSAGVPFETYLGWVEIACKNGASGVAAGRAVWKEAISLKGEEQKSFLDVVAVNRLQKLTKVCQCKGKPVSDFFESTPSLSWFQGYQE